MSTIYWTAKMLAAGLPNENKVRGPTRLPMRGACISAFSFQPPENKSAASKHQNPGPSTSRETSYSGPTRGRSAGAVTAGRGTHMTLQYRFCL
jgi:hypothetical protein